MMRKEWRPVLVLVSSLVVFGVWLAPPFSPSPTLSGQTAAAGQPSTKNGEWPHYTADLTGSRYSPLDQINASNFSKLEVAWRLKTDPFGPFPEYKLEGTPLMVKGVLYTTAGTRRSVIALDPKTGELLWTHSVREGKRAAMSPRQLSGRGVAYWTDGAGDERILYMTTGYRLVSLNAKTGQPVNSFGTNGIVDLKVGAVKGTDSQIDLESGEIGIHSTPVVAGNVVLVGSAFREGMTISTHDNTKGSVRAYDVLTGKQLWRFNTIPRPGEFGNDTWEENSWSFNGNTGVWTQISVDPELGLAYLPVETPTSDFYGGHRPGNNLFAESLVAVDLKTGQRKWHFQFVHHPIWNFDNCCAPLLVGHRRQRKADQGRRPAEQAGVALRARPRDGRAGVANRRAARAAVRCSGREDLADAAAPHQAAGVRAQLRARAGRPDRFHAGVAAAGARGHEALQIRADAVQSVDPRQRQRSAPRRARPRHRHQLAGLRVRSGNAHGLFSRTQSFCVGSRSTTAWCRRSGKITARPPCRRPSTSCSTTSTG